jgi:hypothetical protein
LSAATASLELVSQPETSIVYMARRSDLRLTLKSRYPLRNPVTGQPEGTTRGIFAGFRDGTLRIPREGKVVLVDTLDGGESEELDAEFVHEMLQKHRRYGDRSEGFWMLEQPAPPVSPQEIDRLMEAAARWDVGDVGGGAGAGARRLGPCGSDRDGGAAGGAHPGDGGGA